MFIDVSLMLMHNTYKSMLKNLSNLSKNDNRQQHNTLSNSNMSMLFLLPKTVSLRRWISRRVYKGNVMNSHNSLKKDRGTAETAVPRQIQTQLLYYKSAVYT